MKIPDNPMRINPAGLVDPASTSRTSERPGELGFGERLRAMIRSVNEKQAVAQEKVQDAVTGESDDLHNAMVALEEASVSFRLMLEVRNKMLEAYQEINRMNV